MENGDWRKDLALLMILVSMFVHIVVMQNRVKHVEQMLQDGTDACGEVSK